MVFAAILAGGSGTRVGGNIPKQFLTLGNKPVIIETIDVFLKSDRVDFIYISVNEAWEAYTQDLLKQYYCRIRCGNGDSGECGYSLCKWAARVSDKNI